MQPERDDPHPARRLAGLAVFALLAGSLAVWVPTGPDVFVSPAAAPGAAATARPAAPRDGAPAALKAATRTEILPTPAATWRTGLTPAQEVRCLALLEGSHADVVLLRLESKPQVRTLSKLLGTAPPAMRHLRVRVLDGSTQLYLERQRRLDVIYEPTGEDREVAAGETFFAVLQNGDPVAALIDLPPRAYRVAFAGPALSDGLTASAVQQASASPAPAVQSPFRRMFGKFAARLQQR